MKNQHAYHEECLLKLPATKYRAVELGEHFYFTGKKCKRGHLSVRYASSSNCKSCIEEKRDKVFQNFRGRSSKRSAENQKLAEAAFLNGRTTYESINKCPKGHNVRFVTTNNCVPCSNEQTKKRKNAAKWARIKKIYRMTQDDVVKMLNKQKSLCAICKDSINEFYHIDHCHISGIVRGLLCSKCNQGIGLFREKLEIFENAIKYLRGQNAD